MNQTEEALKPPVIKSIRLTNFLSFGPDTEELKLRPLNVLIGPNGSGKSNLIEAFRLLQACTFDYSDSESLQYRIDMAGGGQEFVWKGSSKSATACIDLKYRSPEFNELFEYLLGFSGDKTANITEERLWSLSSDRKNRCVEYVRRIEGRSAIIYPEDENRKDSESSLALARSPVDHPTGILAKILRAIRFYQRLQLGPGIGCRIPQPAELSNKELQEDLVNLAHVLNRARRQGKLRMKLVEFLTRFLEDAVDLDTDSEGGKIQARVLTKDYYIPATRLSDGTMRWLALLVIFFQENPPPLVCLEEPEIGLHPDMIVMLAELLQEASKRMQLIVTTHSDILIDALSSTPESVVICEKEDGATKMRRLEPEKLEAWLERYSLGELWTSGQLGGTRW